MVKAITGAYQPCAVDGRDAVGVVRTLSGVEIRFQASFRAVSKLV